MKCEFLSASGAKTYESCPLRFFARYELGIKGSSTLAIDAGLLGHKALEMYYHPECKNTAEECFNIASTEFCCTDIDEFNEIKRVYFDYVNSNPKENQNTIGAEIGFQLFFESGASFRGYIDRIDLLDNDTLRILDYKTGKYVPDLEELKSAHQTLLYALWAYRNPEKLPNISYIIVEYHYVRENEKKVISVTREMAESYAKYADALFHTIVEDKKHEPRLNNFCYNCPYRNNCSEYQILIDLFINNNKLCDTEDAKDFKIEDLVNVYRQLSIAEKSVTNEKKTIAKMLVNELKYGGINGKIIGNKSVKLVSKKQAQCNKDDVKEIIRMFNLENQLSDFISANDIKKIVKGNKEAEDELSNRIYYKSIAPYPSVTEIKEKK